jgi:hypothetical protein
MRHGGVAALQNEQVEGLSPAPVQGTAPETAAPSRSPGDKEAIKKAIAELEACRRLLAARA